METIIQKTKQTTEEIATTDKATYYISTTSIDGVIKHISANVFIELEDDNDGEYITSEKKLGTLAWIDGRVKMTAITADNLLPALVEEFIEIVNDIIARQ